MIVANFWIPLITEYDYDDGTRQHTRYFNPLALELDIYSLAHHLCKMWIVYEPIRKYTTFCGGINEDGERKPK